MDLHVLGGDKILFHTMSMSMSMPIHTPVLATSRNNNKNTGSLSHQRDSRPTDSAPFATLSSARRVRTQITSTASTIFLSSTSPSSP